MTIQEKEKRSPCPLTPMQSAGPARYFGGSSARGGRPGSVDFASAKQVTALVLGGGSSPSAGSRRRMARLVLKIAIGGIPHTKKVTRSLSCRRRKWNGTRWLERGVANGWRREYEGLRDSGEQVAGPRSELGAYGQEVSQTIERSAVDLEQNKIVRCPGCLMASAIALASSQHRRAADDTYPARNTD